MKNKNNTFVALTLVIFIGCAENKNLVYSDLAPMANEAVCNGAAQGKKISLVFISTNQVDNEFPLERIVNKIHQDFQNIGMVASNHTSTQLYRVSNKSEFDERLKDNDFALIFFAKTIGDSQYSLDFYFHEVNKNKRILAYTIPLKIQWLNAVAHKISDMVYTCLTGTPGLFASTLISLENNDESHLLKYSGYSGDYMQKILQNRNPVYYARFLPDKKTLVYISEEANSRRIVRQEIFSARRYVLKEVQSLPTRIEIDDAGEQLLYDDPSTNSVLVYNFITGRENIVELKVFKPFSPSWGKDKGIIYFISQKEDAPGIYRYDTEEKALTHVLNMKNVSSYKLSSDESSVFLLIKTDATTYSLIKYDLNSRQQWNIDSGVIDTLGLSPGDLFLYYTKANADGQFTVVKSLHYESGYQLPRVSVTDW